MDKKNSFLLVLGVIFLLLVTATASFAFFYGYKIVNVREIGNKKVKIFVRADPANKSTTNEVTIISRTEANYLCKYFQVKNIKQLIGRTFAVPYQQKEVGRDTELTTAKGDWKLALKFLIELGREGKTVK